MPCASGKAPGRLYVRWAYKPMRLTRRDLDGPTESVLTLTVPKDGRAS
jgi:hypothetical protein